VRRGILGGTFDPPHLAHLIAAETAHEQLELDVVTFMPAGMPWQKADAGVSAAEHRWAMTLLTVSGASYFAADDREVVREGWTYTVDTLGEFPDDELYLVLGADAAAGLPTWHRSEDVLSMATIAVVPRPGTSGADVEKAVAQVKWLDMPEIDVSGTMLRDRRRSGRSIRFFVRDEVHDYIEANSLYAP
jgi:nicotinate-nucleotide adenylyltransferase